MTQRDSTATRLVVGVLVLLLVDLLGGLIAFQVVLVATTIGVGLLALQRLVHVRRTGSASPV